MLTVRQQFQLKFLTHVKKTKSGCWLYQGYIDGDGYGRVSGPLRIYTNEQMAHRVSWKLFRKKKITKKRPYVLHKCDNPPCVRPSHLFLGTQQDNINDMMLKGRVQKVPGGETHHLSKLSDKQAINIFMKFSTKQFSRKQLAIDNSVTATTICYVVNCTSRYTFLKDIF